MDSRVMHIDFFWQSFVQKNDKRIWQQPLQRKIKLKRFSSVWDFLNTDIISVIV
jgi:hypothetical protein